MRNYIVCYSMENLEADLGVLVTDAKEMEPALESAGKKAVRIRPMRLTATETKKAN